MGTARFFVTKWELTLSVEIAPPDETFSVLVIALCVHTARAFYYETNELRAILRALLHK